MSDPQDYSIGWICAITTESVAAQAFLDEEHAHPENLAPNDNNNYVLGKISGHNVVIAVLPKSEYGTTAAATVARDMVHSFPNVRIGLMVGVGGGAPSAKHDIRLGDIVVGIRDGEKGGVFQYDFGKTVQSQEFVTTGHLNQSPQSMLTAVSALEAKYEKDGHQLSAEVKMALKKIKRRKKYSRPSTTDDRLYRSCQTHPPNTSEECAEICGYDPSHLVARPERNEEEDDPAIHYGLIASSNTLMKDATLRDKLAAKEGILCFEMEAAGLMNHFPCLVIRGICDYSDTHKNKDWQGFAALMAAAYAKDLLRHVLPSKIRAEKKISDLLNSMGEKLDHVHQASSETRAEVKLVRHNQNMDRIEAWLSPPNHSTNMNHARELRHQGTGTWLLESEAFKEWTLGSRRHLWLHGLAGYGKTVLCTTIFDHLKKLDDRVMLNFSFDFADGRKQTTDGMIRSLAFQLYKGGTDSRRELDRLLVAHRNGLDQPGAATLLDSLHASMRTAGQKICIVLDALDECTTRRQLLEWMKGFFSTSGLDHVQLIATSRPEEEFQSSLRRSIGQANCLPLDKESINTDIRSYVSARLKESSEFKKSKSYQSMQKKIREEIGDKANGMFRWAACQLDSLERCLDKEGIEATLKSLPRDLNETYCRILENIPPERKAKSIRLLQFLAYSKRSLTVLEAVDVVAVRIDSEPRYFDAEDRIFNPTEITLFCPSLVSITRVTDDDGDEVEELHLAHFSVKEYLLDHHVNFNPLEANVRITQTCLAYLTSTSNEHATQLEWESFLEIEEEMQQKFPLAKYAAEFWMDHASFAEKSAVVTEVSLKFLLSQTAFRAWTRLHQYEEDRNWFYVRKITDASSLYFACFKGLTNIARHIISQGQDVNARGGYYGNALQAASAFGHKQTVQLLIDNCANVNAPGGYYGSALQAASNYGHNETVQLLMDNSANVNAQGGIYGNALQAASAESGKETVQLLIAHGADVNAQGGHYGNALQAACFYGRKETIQILLNNNADVNAQGGQLGNALQAAAFGRTPFNLEATSLDGYKEIVQLLLDNGANVNAQGGFLESPLNAVSQRGHKEIAQLLIENGADPNTQIGDYGNALHTASAYGQREIALLLINNGADVNAQGGEYSNALQAASAQSYQEIVQLLIDNNADVNAQGGRYGSALQAASAGGLEKLVQLLIDSGADVNAQGGKYGNALQAALECSHQDIAKLLIDNGADSSAL